MPNAAKAAFLLAAALAIQTAWAADPAIPIEPAVSGSGAVELNTAPPSIDGAQLFATHCAMCHKPAELARRLQSASDPKAARADMAASLARHGRSDADADAAIIDHLASSSSSPTPCSACRNHVWVRAYDVSCMHGNPLSEKGLITPSAKRSAVTATDRVP